MSSLRRRTHQTPQAQGHRQSPCCYPSAIEWCSIVARSNQTDESISAKNRKSFRNQSSPKSSNRASPYVAERRLSVRGHKRKLPTCYCGRRPTMLNHESQRLYSRDCPKISWGNRRGLRQDRTAPALTWDRKSCEYHLFDSGQGHQSINSA